MADPVPHMAMEIHSYMTGTSELSEEDQKIFEHINRKIPVEVIAEVLSSHHDDRFEHWYQEAE
jgi:hypothetical protein